ncbi:MAG: 50S ribosomal protein L3 N(5)-glutamine methyltransferase [Verrucomicrobia bacterium]|nr:50S ribosomal protein L3 N(5)-glutamine methyltransferase [Verrucomicrobiota bacterium]
MKKPAKKTSRPKELFTRTASLVTFDDWLQLAEELYETHEIALGQISTLARDEVLYLLLRTLELPLDSDASVLDRKLTKTQIATVKNVLQRRIADRVPAAYLTREAFLGEHRFYVDERVIIPRSYFLEIIPQQLNDWLPDPKKVRAVVDVCTGSGCLAILLADHFPKAKVDAIDLSPDALEVAKINVAEHNLAKRIALHESDVFDAVPKQKYDIILSNPPYEPSKHVDEMPDEFHREPRMSLDGGKDGLDIIRKLLRQSRDRLQPHGIVLIEVGGLREAMDKEFAALQPHWLHTEDGADCICVFHAKRLKTAKL